MDTPTAHPSSCEDPESQKPGGNIPVTTRKVTEDQRTVSTTVGRLLLFRRLLFLFLHLTKEKLNCFSFPSRLFHPHTPGESRLTSSRSLDFQPLPFSRHVQRCSGPLRTAADHAPRASSHLDDSPHDCRRLSPESDFQAKRSCFRGSPRSVAQARLQIPFKTTGATYLPWAP